MTRNKTGPQGREERSRVRYSTFGAFSIGSLAHWASLIQATSREAGSQGHLTCEWAGRLPWLCPGSVPSFTQLATQRKAPSPACTLDDYRLLIHSPFPLPILPAPLGAEDMPPGPGSSNSCLWKTGQWEPGIINNERVAQGKYLLTPDGVKRAMTESKCSVIKISWNWTQGVIILTAALHGCYHTCRTGR